MPLLKDKFRKVSLYLHKENLGLRGRNNIAFASSLIDTEYVQVLEGDDYYTPTKTEECLEVLRTGCGMVHGDFFIVKGDKVKDELAYTKGWSRWTVKDMPEGQLYNILLKKNIVLTCTAAFSSELYRKAYDYSLFTSLGVLLGDYAGTIRMSRLTDIKYINNEIAYYRSHPNSTINKYRAEMIEDTKKLQALAREGVI